VKKNGPNSLDFGGTRSQNIKGFFKKLLSHMVYSNIWLNLFVDDHQLDYITKLEKKKLGT
jgi:hypothetical protein